MRDKIHMLGCDGQYKTTLTKPETHQDKHFSCYGIAVSLHSHHIMAIYDAGLLMDSVYATVAVYSGDGEYLHCFTTLTSPKRAQRPGCLAVDKDEQAVVVVHNGACEKAVITIHKCPSGELIRKVTTDRKLSSDRATMAINSKKHILVHIYESCSVWTNVHCLDYSGNTLFTLFPDTLDSYLYPHGIVCDQSDNIYIAMGPHNPGADRKKAEFGRINKYSPCGTFLQIAVRDILHIPYVLAIAADGSLVVSDQNSIRRCHVWL